MRLAIVALCAGCGGTSTSPDAGVEATPCMASFTGNFTEQSTALANCPTLAASTGSGDPTQLLRFAVPSTTIATTVAIKLDLGAAPTPGAFSSETIATWSSLAVEPVGSGECAFSAGNFAVPTGSFTLTLDTLDLPSGTAHGTIAVLDYVLALLGTNCGPGDTETVQITF